MEAPSDYKTVGIFMTVSGALNLIVGGLVLLSSACMFCWSFLGMFAGIAELIMGIMILQGSKQPMAMAVSIFGLVGALTTCSGISIVLEILALVWLQKPEVKEYLSNA